MSKTPDPCDMRWVSSTYSDGQGGQCVQWAPDFATTHGVVPIRDSKLTDSPVLILSPGAFAGLVELVRADA
uniref:DUF397 domain-containing protein n=1 Tax=Streptomyces sp. NBC_00003 TaxID=2903608 RepID=A0AAU2V9Y1_9ACTN